MKRLLRPLLRRTWSSLTISRDNDVLKPFDAIPGPKPLPAIGNKWRYLPLIGEYKIHEMDVNSELKLRKYGKVVREVIDKNLTILHVFDPKDMEAVFRQEGRYPCRRSHRALLKYRADRPHLYSSGGLFPENGVKWYDLRRKFQQRLMSAASVGYYVGECETITAQLIRYIRDKRDAREEMVDFLNDLYLWALENTGVLALDSRLGCLYADQLADDSDVKRLIRAAHETNEAVMRTEMTDAWQTSDTRDYKSLVSAQDTMAEIIDKYLSAKSASQGSSDNNSAGDDHHKTSILSHFLSDPHIDRKDLFAMIVDLFLAGIDTTAFSAGFALYHLSRNTGAQHRLRQEIDSILPTRDTPLTPELLARMTYLKACVKETMRLTPVAFGVGRVTTSEMTIAGYRVPKGTQIITENQVASRQPEYFPDPKAYVPERWLKTSGSLTGGGVCPAAATGKRSPFLVLPFGYGPRMCIGRRFAEMEIYVFLAKVIQNFRI
ncbi:unnamed protein product, partial [Oppiella nova]